MKRNVLIIASLVACLSFSFVAFAVTVDELKEVFLTRQEFEKWANVDCGETDASGNVIGMSEYLEGIEEKKQLEVYDEAGYQMYRRDILSKDVLASLESATLESYSIRRSKELETQVLFGGVFGSAIAPSEETSKASPSNITK